MKRTIIFLWLPLLLLAFLTSCNDSGTVSVSVSGGSKITAPKNTPVTANVPNSYSFVVSASSYSYNETNAVQMNADTLSIGITVTSFEKGSGSFVIKDSSDTIIYQKDFNGSAVIAEVMPVTKIPKSVILNLSNFTGDVVIGLAGK